MDDVTVKTLAIQFIQSHMVDVTSDFLGICEMFDLDEEEAQMVHDKIAEAKYKIFWKD